MSVSFERTANPNQWALVLAGVSDFARPAESLSLTQNAALTCTGAIWTRWCLIIKPKNVLYVLSHPYHTRAGANHPAVSPQSTSSLDVLVPSRSPVY